MEDLRRFILNLPQIVPESECLECKICCRFPDTENVQTPFWSGLETNWAKRDNPGSGSWFKPEPASPSLSPRLVACGGSGYRCPAFEQETHRCRIHAVKPLDCRLYPFVLASNPGQTEVLLAMDTKCPFIERHPEDPALVAYATKLVEYLDTEAGLEYLRTNPKVVGPAWPEYLWMGALPRATGWIQAPLDKGSGCPTGQGEPERKPPHPSLRPFQEEDLPALKRALRARPRSASHYTLASLIGWSDLIRLWWAPLKEGGMALFSEQAGGLFLPVPPLADPEGEGPVREAWEILEQANQGSAVSRIEGIETAAVGGFKEMGFSIRRAETEYLYETAGLARLSGDGYRSQRWAVNRCLKSIPVRIRKFEQGDVVACLQLYTRWAIRRQKAASDDLEKRLLRDSLFYHRRLMMDRDRLGLWGRVLESEGKILAYTFGGEISAETFGLFAEIADREVPGLAQTLFREFCREIEKSGFRRVNAMGDAGLPALRQAKMAYRPSALLPVFTATKE